MDASSQRKSAFNREGDRRCQLKNDKTYSLLKSQLSLKPSRCLLMWRSTLPHQNHCKFGGEQPPMRRFCSCKCRRGRRSWWRRFEWTRSAEERWFGPFRSDGYSRSMSSWGEESQGGLPFRRSWREDDQRGQRFHGESHSHGVWDTPLQPRHSHIRQGIPKLLQRRKNRDTGPNLCGGKIISGR